MHKFDTKFFLSVAQIRSIIIPVSTSFKKAIEVMDNGGLQVVLVLSLIHISEPTRH